MANKWLLIAAAAVCSLAIPACEDNPDQFFKKAPAGAGDRWNNGETPGVYTDAKNRFTDNYNTSTKQELCSGPIKQKTWAKMVNEPLKPPCGIAGVDICGGDQWTGLDFRDAEKSLCQSKSISGTEATLEAAWGDANEVRVEYRLSTNKIETWSLWPGYRGVLKFKSREKSLDDPTKPNPYGNHEYEIAIGKPILRDGKTWELNWTKACTPNDGPGADCWDRQSTEIYDALMATYAPDLPSTQESCLAGQLCLARAFPAGYAIMGVRQLGTYFYIPSVSVPQPGPSTPGYMYGFYVKLMPFSGSDMFLKLDGTGPMSVAMNLGSKKATCAQRLGMKYSEFMDGCINIEDKPEANKEIKTKLVGGMAHTKEAFNFSIEGVNLDFLSGNIGEDKTVGDDWEPQPNDVAYEMEMDIRASGNVVNDFTKPIPAVMVDGKPTCPDPTAPSKVQIVYDETKKDVVPGWGCAKLTMLGTGAIYREYARRVQKDIHQKLRDWLPPKEMASNGSCDAGWEAQGGKCVYKGLPLGAPECLEPNTLDQWRKNGCTGFEQFVMPASPDYATPGPDAEGIKKLSVGGKPQQGLFKTALKAGDPSAVFCSDPGTFRHCAEGNGGYTEKILHGSYQRVLDIIGGGNPLDIPPQLRDRKYYFRHFAYAIVKYLKAAKSYPLDLHDPQFMPGGDACKNPNATDPEEGKYNCEPEPDHLLFDQVGATGDRDKFEYIDRRFVTATQEPLKVEYEILITSSNQQEWKYHRKMTRPEKALYRAISEDPNQPLGGHGDNVRLTNIVGSTIIAGAGYRGVPECKGTAAPPGCTPPGAPIKTAHYCASTLIDNAPDPDCAKIGSIPPQNSLTGAWMTDDFGQPLMTNYKGAFGNGTIFTLGTSFLKMKREVPEIKSAFVEVPFFPDPYNPGGPTGNAAAPQMPTVLVDWRPKTPANGIRIPVNAQLDRFIPSATMSFGGNSLTLDIDYAQQADGSMKLEAIQSDEYMGNIFICQDPNTGDFLSVEQYESMEVILSWLNAHPGSAEACEIIVRYSSFNQFPVMFAAKAAGVVLNVGQGSGVGRITYIEVYDTSL